VFKILSNGYRYDKEVIDVSLNKYESFIYQISLDGLRDNHDFIRGYGSYDKAIETIKSIKRDFPNVFLQIAFNAHHHNNDDLMELTKIVKDLGCNKIFYDRYVPYWKSELVMLTQEEYNKHTAYINQAYDLYNDDTFTVFRARSLQFDNKYRCQSGVRNQIAKADGTRISCTRYHVECGNWYTDDVDTLVEKSIRAEIKTLPVPISCISCDRLKTCRGGMRCLSWACTNKFDIKDIHCVR
jgi:MoaA/NifB/PqqE/SkfB family radical SAM enzyme